MYASGRLEDRNLLTAWDVRVRLLLALGAILAVLLSTRAWFGLLVAACCVAGLKAFRLPARPILSWLAAPLALATVMGLLQTFATGHTPLFSCDLGPWHLVATREGLGSGAILAGRVLGTVSLVMTACTGIATTELFHALRWARVSQTWIEIAILMHRYILILFEQAVSVVSAQKVRLGYSSVRQSFRSMGSLAGIVMLRSLDQAEKSHGAMIARGYQGTLPLPTMAPLSKRQWAFTGGGLLLIGLAYVFAQRCPW
jgi:cobalt/nickel transport system permease protein